MENDLKKADLLEGAAAIADHLGVPLRRAQKLIADQAIPCFKVAGRVCARRSGLNAWLADCEAKAREGRS